MCIRDRDGMLDEDRDRAGSKAARFHNRELSFQPRFQLSPAC